MFQTAATEEEWNEVASDFLQCWNMPNTLGAIDGKLIHVQRPVRCGGQYFNYKRSFSVNMMAVVDAHYRFMYVAVGAQGSTNDAAVFAESNFGKALASRSNPLSISPARNITGTNIETPLFFVGDEAYPFKPYIMKPFSARGLTASERIFNYRLSRARRVTENAFGISSYMLYARPHFSRFVRKITLIIDIPSIPFLSVTTRIPFHHPAHPGPLGRRGRYTRAVSQHHVVCIMYDIPFPMSQHAHMPSVPFR